jgi:hypothetical protein
MRRILVALALAVVASAAVYVSEGGDVVYFSTLGQFGALNDLCRFGSNDGEPLPPPPRRFANSIYASAPAAPWAY